MEGEEIAEKRNEAERARKKREREKGWVKE
jgi:hypothetical protein